MKAVTHLIFSLGAGLYVVGHLRSPSTLFVFLVLWLSLAVNSAIDFGHSIRNGRPVRSWLTHSVYSAPMWGGLIGALSVLVPDYLLNRPPDGALALIGLGLGVLTAYTHLLLDSVTEGGIYRGRRRIAIAHASYDNRFLNAAFIAAGLLLAALVLR